MTAPASSQSAAHRALAAATASASAVLSVLPGVVVFSQGAYAPPGQKELFGTVIAVVSPVTLLLLTLYRTTIARMPRGRAVAATVAVLAAGLLALAAFAFARARAVCPGPNEGDEVYVLLFPPPVVAAAAAQEFGLCRAVLASRNANDIRQEVLNAPGRLIASNAVFLLLYLTMNVAAVSALAIAGWRAARDDPPPEVPGEAAAGASGAKSVPAR